MADAVYILCALTSLTCSVLLARAYVRTPSRFLLFSSVCFAALTINSLLLVVDRIIYPESIDLRPWRLAVAAGGLAVMLWSFITQKN
mgnify:FL=1|jgi:hypothetical protein